MNQNPQPNKKPTAPPQPQWNPYYRRNPDGTPGGHDRTLQENAARADAEARQVRERQTPAREGARSAQQMPTREGLGNLPQMRPARPVTVRTATVRTPACIPAIPPVPPLAATAVC